MLTKTEYDAAQNELAERIERMRKLNYEHKRLNRKCAWLNVRLFIFNLALKTRLMPFDKARRIHIRQEKESALLDVEYAKLDKEYEIHDAEVDRLIKLLRETDDEAKYVLETLLLEMTGKAISLDPDPGLEIRRKNDFRRLSRNSKRAR